jgi:beta-barrel assembly-enhancing protease
VYFFSKKMDALRRIPPRTGPQKSFEKPKNQVSPRTFSAKNEKTKPTNRREVYIWATNFFTKNCHTMFGQQPARSGGFRIPPTLIIALVMAGFTLFKYYANSSTNDITGEVQRISMTPDQEIAMGIQSAPQMIAEMGGEVRGQQADALVRAVGQKLVANTSASRTAYAQTFDFHLLNDPNTVNAFAMPGGQIFITTALLGRLENEDQLAGVLGHEIGHVVGRHSAEKLAQMELAQGLSGAVTMATYDPTNPAGGRIAQSVANMLQLKYGREQELQSDDLGVRFMLEAGYNPEELIGVMEILKQAGGGQRVPEFQSSHPDPENRKQKIQEAIAKYRGATGR